MRKLKYISVENKLVGYFDREWDVQNSYWQNFPNYLLNGIDDKIKMPGCNRYL